MNRSASVTKRFLSKSLWMRTETAWGIISAGCTTWPLDLGCLAWPILAKRAWPKIRSQQKRAIAAEKHGAVLACEGNDERRAYYELLYETGTAQTDGASFDRRGY
jgi:hypothetical protein